MLDMREVEKRTFEVNRKFGQRFVLSSWFFNFFFDRVVGRRIDGYIYLYIGGGRRGEGKERKMLLKDLFRL